MRFASLLGFMLVLVAPGYLRAAGKEERVYNIFADKKPAGTLKLVIEERADGVETAAFAVAVKVKYLLKEYNYSLRGYEVWKKDKLLKVETQTDDDGKKMTLKVEAEKEGLIVTTDGKQGLLKADAWTTTYWKMPAGERVLMDADTGKILDAKWEKVGVETLTLMGRQVVCNHWRVTGAVKAELWFDGSDRMVRQETVESGIRMITELSQYKRD
ncbi:hypothetical protein KIH39_12470 [Telmatocola sphagniphila]|jgi:hypothetical protein|uniref:Uncharacterized protein n=1 Tax=Telmatocola sphagniphila TaxID=1123043 RepID=A0A8E6BCJ7_9BACT|nr:DUF6134 family protein [Telmatocola sphagniphila]QVL34683.1 hypothetical protein KIH39_12470 [Telmatocola sphagniphila]